MRALAVCFIPLLFLLGCSSLKKPGLPDGYLEKGVSQYRENIGQCFLKAHERKADVYKPVEVIFYIGNLGGVTNAFVNKNETEDEKLGQCLTAEVNKMKFDNPPGQTTYRIHYTFALGGTYR